ncbi:MAG: PKD domain-containing protein [Bacteroidota bacterium]
MNKPYNTSQFRRVVVSFLIINLLLQTISPSLLIALTSGPSQPEFQSFSPIDNSGLVDPFTGDFSYNIPLMDVGGYPVNISYNAGIGMDQEASWVGLGWNLNVGAITRNMRGLPDDFNGDLVQKELNLKPNETYSVSSSASFAELFGVDLSDSNLSLSAGIGANYNTYTGPGLEFNLDPSFNLANTGGSSLTLGLGFSASSEQGLSVSANLNYGARQNETDWSRLSGLSVGSAYNSRAGLKALTISDTYTSKLSSVRFIRSTTGRKVNQGNTEISFSTPSYTPQMKMDMNNFNISVSATLGGEVFGLHNNLNFQGRYSRQALENKQTQAPAFGYLNAHYGAGNPNALMDFNREKDGSFTKHTPGLPLTNFTFDIFSVSGHGIGGMYRAARGDIGILFDAEVKTKSSSVDPPGIELGGGNGVHLGSNVTINKVDARSGNWTTDNNAAQRISFKAINANNPLYQPSYLRQAGELTAHADPTFIQSIGGYHPVRIKLNPNTEDVPAMASYEQFTGGENANPISTLMSTTGTLQNRDHRNEVISYATGVEATSYGLEKNIPLYRYPTQLINCDNDNNAPLGNYASAETLSRLDDPHHISEMTVVRADGLRYIYGLPVYNKEQQEVSFTIQDGSANCETGLVSYSPGVNDSPENTDGEDGYYSKTTLPDYTHSFLLTAILSPDYVDVTGNGPSDDDLGTYTKFNYSLSHSNYQWRTPYQAGQASHNEGLKSKNLQQENSDDKGSYLYGRKEIYYLHSIVTKTHVAEFKTAPRVDAYEVASNAGGRGSASLELLKSITLYAKPDRLNNGSDALPLKTVHFAYNYSLCQGIPNNNTTVALDESGFENQGGKLTLKKLWFSYQGSKKGYLSPYEFFYGEVRNKDGMLIAIPNQANPYNPDYKNNSYDRWGNYKLQTSITSCDPDQVDNLILSPITNAEYSYVDQGVLPSSQNFDPDLSHSDRTRADLYSYAWNLTTIKTPSGSNIKIDYEADDYAFVQDRRAMRMFKVVGMTYNKPASTDVLNGSINQLYESDNPYQYLIIKLPDRYAATNTAQFYHDFLKGADNKGIEQLYFRFLINLLPSSQGKAFEYVQGYTQIDWTASDSYGLISDGNSYTHAYIKIKEVEMQDLWSNTANEMVNPIAHAGWHFAKLYRPRLAYNQSDPNAETLAQIWQSLISIGSSIGDFAIGYYQTAQNQGFSQRFVPGKSWVRLQEPTRFKKGGGHRVKRIAMSDQWREMTGSSEFLNAQYGQQYDYSTSVPLEGSDFSISSGVAIYEPALGNDENPFRLPVFYNQENTLVPDDRFYQEEPFGESLFPSPSVGYSKVTIQSLQYEQVSSNATGKVVHEFYTAKDYPTITQKTTLKSVRKRSNPVVQLLNIKNRDYMTASQGFLVELNDMHGKPRAVNIYAEGKSFPISGTRYSYLQTGTGQLNNVVTTLDANGAITQQDIGVDVDFVADMREHTTQTKVSNYKINLDAFLVGLIPIIVPFLSPDLKQEETRFRSASTTKVINRYGILKSVTAFDLGSELTTENVLYDATTGEVLLTKTINSFEDPVYEFTYPAHLIEQGMGPAYKNIDLRLTTEQVQAFGQLLFVEGDEIVKLDTGEKAWIISQNGLLIPIKANGNLLEITGGVKLIRSGRRNQQNTPVGQVVSLANPLRDTNADGQVDALRFEQVIDASATQMSDDWKAYCGCGLQPGDSYNPYVHGFKGNFHPQKTYRYLTGRTQSNQNGNTNIRTDGVYADFSPFWRPPFGNTTWTANPTNWTFTAEATHVDAFGNELENRDALNRYSAAQYGYNNTYPVAVAANARYREIGYDGFEDYDFCNCVSDHFGFESVNLQISNTVSHSGRQSLSLEAGQSILMEKRLLPCQQLTRQIVEADYVTVPQASPENDCNTDTLYILSGYDELNETTLPTGPTMSSADISWMIRQDEDPGSTEPRPAYAIEPASTAWKPAMENTKWITSYPETGNSTTGDYHFVYEFCLPETLDSPTLDLQLRSDNSAGVYLNGHFLGQTPNGISFKQDPPVSFFTSDPSHFMSGSNELMIVNKNNGDVKGINVRGKLYGQSSFDPCCEALGLISGRKWHDVNGDGILQEEDTVLSGWPIYLSNGDTTYTDAYGFYVFADLPAAEYMVTEQQAEGWITTMPPTGQYIISLAPGQISDHNDFANAEVSCYQQEHLGTKQVCYNDALLFSLSNIIDSSDVEVNWEFGDGNTAIGQNTYHVYEESGVYSVQATFLVDACLYQYSYRVFVTDCLECEQCIAGFAPLRGKKYQISAWVREQRPTGKVAFNDPAIAIRFYPASVEQVFQASGLIIDGWQRIEGTFIVPSDALVFRLELMNQGSTDVYFDDIRIHPFQASMKSFVYDPLSLRLMAELDERNYASFYEYDEQGQLIRVKKETERGVMTLQESGQHTQINQ